MKVFMKIDIITLFPDLFAPFINESIIKRAIADSYLTVNVHNLRQYATDNHKTVDDTPYGGGTGMVLKVDVVDKALADIIKQSADHSTAHRILLTPQGERLTAPKVESLAKHEWIILICGHYEGFDERIREHLVDEQISIGDFVLTGGELPALVVMDAVARFIPGVLPESAPNEDSFSLKKDGHFALEYPHYTRPLDYKGWKVPEVLLSGNHAEIAKWRESQLKISNG